MKDENKKYIKIGITGVVVIAVSLLFFFILYRLQSIFDIMSGITAIVMPFIYGAVIAYILAPVCNKLERLLTKLFKPKAERSKPVCAAAIILSLIIALAIVWALVMLVFPQVWSSVVNIANAVPAQLENANAWLHNVLKNEPELQEYWDEFSVKVTEGITNWLNTGLLTTVSNIVVGLGSQLTIFFAFVKNLFLGILISVYFLASRRQFAAQSKLLLYGAFPKRWATMIEEEAHYADRMFNGFLMGKLLDSAIIGVLCFIGTALMGIKSAALVSVIVGVTNIIPFFGPFIGAIPSALLLLLENPLHCVYFIIFMVVLQQLDGNVIGPKILGNSTGLSSFWVLFSILLFGGLWGIIGMIVGVPLFAVIYDVVRRLTAFGLAKHEGVDMMESYNTEFHPPVPVKKPTKFKRRKK